jgi:hypothetical protein
MESGDYILKVYACLSVETGVVGSAFGHCQLEIK